jgi:predicted Kef-type K+ transport protein
MLKNLLGNLISFLISAAIIIGVIALCIAFPPLILVIIAIVIFGKFKGTPGTKDTD